MKRTLLLAATVTLALSANIAPGVIVQAHDRSPSFEVWEKTIPELLDALAANETTARDLVTAYLERIEAYDVNGPALNAIRHINRRALQIAHRLDQKRKHDRGSGPLFGIPIILKDNIDTVDQPTTAGSLALEGSVPLRDAFLTRELRQAGAVILGKANLTEFANFVGFNMPAGFSSLGDFSFNPYDPRRGPPDDRPILTPGGSSSGPGIVVAASLAAAAIGTETNGSILGPANQLSLVGIKPTVGLVSRSGIIPLARAQDTAGPLARTVTDAAIVLGAITAADAEDSATLAPERVAEHDYTRFLDVDALRGARIGVAWGRNAAGNPAYFYSALGPAQRALVDAAIVAMRTLGAEVFLVEIDTAQALSDTQFSSVVPYEFKRDLNAYLSRLRHRVPVRTLSDVIAFNDAYPDQSRFRFGQDILRISDAFDLDAMHDEYLADLALDRFLSRTGIDGALQTHNLDALLFGGVTGGGIGARAGYPSVIVPSGYLSTNGAPYGITFCGTAWSESRLIALAFAYEQATRMRRPPTTSPPLTHQ